MLFDDLKSELKGEVLQDDQTLSLYSHDTSLFELKPQIVIFPQDSDDVKKIVKFTSANKKNNPKLSITARSAGTDMSGGAINDSIILDFTKHINHIIKIEDSQTQVEPGVLYRDFEKEAQKQHLLLPSYPASKNICALGGMVNNNSGGEKSLVHGKTIDYVQNIKMVLSDGNEYEFSKLNQKQLETKLKQKDFEGEVYRKIYNLCQDNYELIKSAKPKVSKNSTGYNIWDVWDKETFDLSKIFIGAQGTLGLNTKTTLRLIKSKNLSGLLVVYLNDMKVLPSLIVDVVKTKPDSFEAFDDRTLGLAIKFIPQFAQILGPLKTVQMGLQFLPDLAGFLLKGLPKFTLLVEYEGDTQEEVSAKIENLHKTIKHYNLKIEEAANKAKAENYWLIRRESFNILRKKVKNKHTAPFIDDFIVPPDHLVEFFPKLVKILDDYEIEYTTFGHMGDGNFHIVPLMNLADSKDRDKIPVVAKLVNQLVIDFHGSISAEHNEGLIRGPFIRLMYGDKMYEIFKEIKNIFDPQNIFNPHKKTDATMEYSMSHIRQNF
jgi:FAD/FMN-containing dehydrogenase